MVHLGARVSALLDGCLPAAEAQRCWEHAQTCPACRDLVEREAWLKRQLAGLSTGEPDLSQRLKEQLRATAAMAPCPAVGAHKTWSRGMVAVGGSALGVAVLGVVALGSGAPITRGPTASLGGASGAQTSTDAPRPAPTAAAAAGRRRHAPTETRVATPVAMIGTLSSAEVVELVVSVAAVPGAASGPSLQAVEPVRGTMAP